MFTPISALPMGNILQTSYDKSNKKPSRVAKLRKQGPPPRYQGAK